MTARHLAPTVALLLVALAPGTAGAAEVTVTVGDSFFEPGTVEIEAGTTVRWVQDGGAPHSVTADDGSFDSHPACTSFPGGCMQDGDTYSRTFTQPGIVPYYCKIHGSPGGNGMAGVVRIVDETGVVPSTVSGLSASRLADSVSVSGTALFGAQPAVKVADDPTGDAPGPADLGLDLTKASIGQPDPKTGNLAFTLDLSGLPDTGGVPEMVRYQWDFAIKRGTDAPKPLQIDGRFTDVIRRQSMRMPSFVLRGNCVSANNQITCTDAGFLDTVMDATGNRIRVTVPRTLLEQQVGGSIAGAVIEPVDICEGISSKLGPHSNLCGAQGQETGDEIVVDDTRAYEVASPSVAIGVVPAGSAPAYATQAAVAESGSFAGTVSTTGLAPGAYDVVVRACYGTNCGTASVPITL